jgi:3-phenylpropionate/trans-cinnamate dioxygenase ferredoxin subunit
MYVSVGKLNEFPSGYVRGFKLNGEDVAVVNLDGAFFAFSNACTHENVDLAETDLDGTRLTCTFHGSVFDVTTGEAIVGPAYKPLAQYNVHIEGEEVLVGKD